MGAPRLSESNEKHRQQVVEALRARELRKEPALDRVAAAIASICNVPTAHVSLMEDDVQRVVGEVGMDQETFRREDSFCAHTLADNRVLVIEDATEDSRFADSPYVQSGPEIRFYVGLPLVVDGVPVGTMCVLDDEPREIELKQRTELFGAVNAVEALLRVRHKHGVDSFEETICRKLTAARASATAARFDDEMSEFAADRVLEVERDLRGCIDLLDIEGPASQSRLGFEDTDTQ